MAITLINTTTVGTAVATITLSSLPQTYTDLLIVVSPRTDDAGATTRNLVMKFNADSGANYAYKHLRGSGATVAVGGGTAQTGITVTNVVTGATATAITFGNISITIPNYAGSASKMALINGVSEQNVTTAYQTIDGGSWTSTAAITSIALTTTGNFVTDTVVSIYGVLTGSSGGVTVA
jgi:hypothetical protein